ncbi:MAG: MerR family transcriptional regulator [Anaeroplasmataceae bacterium]|nr:MerR family transcriptional regulator [Anaeroplasmataceae bacterium]
MKIKELAKQVNLSISTIRYYEKIGLIKPLKQGYYKQYTDFIKEELIAIDKLHKAGLKLSQIQFLMSLNDKEIAQLRVLEINQINALLSSTMKEITLKQQQLATSKKLIQNMLLKVKKLYENCE